MMTSGRKDYSKYINRCYSKFPFLVTSVHFRLFGLDKKPISYNWKDDGLQNKKDRKEQSLPVGVRTGPFKYGAEYFRKPFGPEECCRRNPISATGPQDHTHEIVDGISSKYVTFSTTYNETIGKTGEEILNAMKEYYSRL